MPYASLFCPRDNSIPVSIKLTTKQVNTDVAPHYFSRRTRIVRLWLSLPKKKELNTPRLT